MSEWSDKFNALPYEIRNIATMCEAETRIQMLNMEKKRLKKAYRSSLSEINAHISNIQKFLDREGKLLPDPLEFEMKDANDLEWW